MDPRIPVLQRDKARLEAQAADALRMMRSDLFDIACDQIHAINVRIAELEAESVQE